MKILEVGKNTEEITCYRCKSRLEINENDIEPKLFGMCGDYETEYCVTCPVCGETIRLERKNHIVVQIYLNKQRYEAGKEKNFK